jgi:hypothetical protein
VNSQGVAMMTTDLVFLPGSSGNDEISLKVK